MNVEQYADAVLRGDALAGIKAAAALQVFAETRHHAVCRRRDGSVRWQADAKNRVTTAGLNKLIDATFKTGSATPAWYLGLVGQSITDAAITAGSATLNSASNPWLAADAGRNIIVRGAAAAGADLVTSILAFSSAGAVTLAASANTTVSGARAVWECRAEDTMASHTPWNLQTAISNATRPAFTPGAITGGSVNNVALPAVFIINADNTHIGGMFMVDDNTVGGSTGTLYGMAVWTAGGFRQSFTGDSITVTTAVAITSG